MTNACASNLTSLSSDEFGELARRREIRFLLGSALFAVLAGCPMALGVKLFPVTLVLAVTIPFLVLLWHRPEITLYGVFGAACLFELQLTGARDALTDRMPLFWNVNTIFQVYGHINFKALPFNPIELLLGLTGLLSLVRAVYTHTLRIDAGTLFRPICIYLAFVILGMANGWATGGDSKIILMEVRAQFLFLVAYLIGVKLGQSPRALQALLWTTVISIGLKGLLYAFRRHVTMAGLPLPDQGVGSHEEAFFFDAFEALLMVWMIFGVQPRLRRWMLWLLPVVILGNVACNRRAATAALAIAAIILLATTYRALPERRRSITVILLALLVIGPPYYFVFKKSESVIGAPARAIASSIEPSDRDRSSNLYRDQENRCLMATVRSSPLLGYGYGKHMIHAVAMADISKTYEFWDIMTHNQILWLWMRVGTFGFIAFWVMIVAIVIRACQVAVDETRTRESRAMGTFCLLVVTMLMIFGLLDLQLSNMRDMLFSGVWVGVLGGLSAVKRSTGRLSTGLTTSR